MESKTVKLGKYRHFKGKVYEVIGCAIHSETMEELVLYKNTQEGNGQVFARPVKMFFENIEFNGKIIPRFTPA